MQRRVFRRLFVGLCIVAHLASTSGFAVPEVVQADTSARPFPCQHHRCGCSSADQCWRSCCCMTQQEKLAWARKNDVEPPEFVVAAATLELEQVRQSKRSCCSHSSAAQTTGGSCSAKATTSCNHHAPQRADDQASDHRPASATIDWVLGIHALQCQGFATWWISTGAVIAPPPLVESPLDISPPLWCTAAPACVFQAIFMQPAIPPPQIA